MFRRDEAEHVFHGYEAGKLALIIDKDHSGTGIELGHTIF